MILRAFQVFTVFIMVCFVSGQAQDIPMMDGQTFAICSGTLYDTGGANGNYGMNENITMTLCPENPGDQITSLDFSSFDLSYGDQLCIYDGVTSNATLIGCYASSQLNGQTIQATNNNSTGCLTLVFTSDDWSEGTGFSAAISCGFPCQDFGIDFTSTIPTPNVDGYLVLCQGDQLSANIAGDYYENDAYYNQSDASTTFTWAIGDQQYTGTNVTATFTEGGYQPIAITAIDVNGCANDTLLTNVVFVMNTPSFDSSMYVTDSVICLGDSIVIQGSASVEDIAIPIGDITAGVTFLPDGSGVSYSTSVTLTQFDPAASITDISDIDMICINMEHSYLGDLEAYIECPNGSVVELINSYDPGNLPGGFGGGGTFLGDPIDDDSNLDPGDGWNYCFSSTQADWGSMETEYIAGNTVPATLYPGNNSMNPNGVYLPQTSFSNFIGCPINGDWTITIVDNIGSDNGYIFQWGVNFAAHIMPPDFVFDAQIVDLTWENNPEVNQGNNGVAIITPTSTGTFDYTFQVTDNNGCTYDTTMSVTVLDSISFDIVSQNGCEPLYVPFENYSTTANVTDFIWDFGDGEVDTIPVGTTPDHWYDSVGVYSVTLTALGACKSTNVFADEIEVYAQANADYLYSPGVVAEMDPTISLVNQSQNADYYEWYVNDVLISDAFELDYTFESVSCFDVALIAKNDEGCNDSTMQNICVESMETLYMPNAFTPDGDGINETFHPIGAGEVYNYLEFFIFDRWGNMLFHSTDPNNGWNGEDANGLQLASGVYVWRVRTTEVVPGKDPIDMLGHVTLIR